MNYLLFLLYLIIFCWLLLRVPLIKNAGINNKVLLGLFLFKIMAGIAIGWIAIHIYGPGNDYWDINNEAWIEFELIKNNPVKYFSNIFTSNYEGGYSGIFSSTDSYWNDLKGNILIKLVSIFNIFSRGDYYINSLFFNFFIFFGHVILYKLFIKIYPGRQTMVIIGCFLLPSALYFSSGIHKDGIVFLMLAMLTYCIYQSIRKNKVTLIRLLLILFSLALLFLIRSFIFLALLPALVAWLVSEKTKWPAGRIFILVYLLTGLLIFNMNSVISKIKPLEIITAKQTEYIKLPRAATQIELAPLKPDFKSFAVNVPEALNHSLLRPYLWEIPVISLLPLSIELFLYQGLLILVVFFSINDFNKAEKTFLFFTVFFTLSVLIFIGYMIPNLGSLVRYRSLYLPLIITSILCNLDWVKLADFFKIQKNNI